MGSEQSVEAPKERPHVKYIIAMTDMSVNVYSNLMKELQLLKKLPEDSFIDEIDLCSLDYICGCRYSPKTYIETVNRKIRKTHSEYMIVCGIQHPDEVEGLRKIYPLVITVRIQKQYCEGPTPFDDVKCDVTMPCYRLNNEAAFDKGLAEIVAKLNDTSLFNEENEKKTLKYIESTKAMNERLIKMNIKPSD